MEPITEEKLAALKQYLRVDTDEDDTLLSSLYDAARLYLENAGVPEPEENNPLYDLAVQRLAVFYYDQRNDMQEDIRGNVQLTPGLNSMILQLRYSTDTEA